MSTEVKNEAEHGMGSGYEEDHKWYEIDSNVTLEWAEPREATIYLVDDDLMEITRAHTDGGRSLWCTENKRKKSRSIPR